MSSISGISSNSSISSILQNMQSKATEKFKELDTDSNGGLDKTELSTMAKELSKMTGKTINVDDAMKTYDANGDGKLSQDEADTMVQKTIGSPSSTGAQAMKAYQANSGNDDQMSMLLKMLGKTSDSSSTSSTSSTSSSGNDQFSALLDMLNNTTDSSSTSNSMPNSDAMFKQLDSDGNGSLNQSELDTFAKDVKSMTGQTIDTKNAISTFDKDGDGALNKSEMDTMMKTEHGKSGTKTEEANSGNDQFSMLMQMLEKSTASQSTDLSNDLSSYA